MTLQTVPFMIFFFGMLIMLVIAELQSPDYTKYNTETLKTKLFKGVIDYEDGAGRSFVPALGGTDKVWSLGVNSNGEKFAIDFPYSHLKSDHPTATNCSASENNTPICSQNALFKAQLGDSIIKKEIGNKLYINGEPAFVYKFR